jgi:hypothetical protein
MCDGVHGLAEGPSSGREPQATRSRKRARCALDRRPPRVVARMRLDDALHRDGVAGADAGEEILGLLPQLVHARACGELLFESA